MLKDHENIQFNSKLHFLIINFAQIHSFDSYLLRRHVLGNYLSIIYVIRDDAAIVLGLSNSKTIHFFDIPSDEAFPFFDVSHGSCNTLEHHFQSPL